MKRPIESDYTSQVAYTRALEKYCDPLAAQQEPVAWMQDSIELYVQDHPSAYYTIPLYTSPPAQRTWVGLTDKEAMQICVDCGCLSEDWLTFLDAIETKLRSKNEDRN